MTSTAQLFSSAGSNRTLILNQSSVSQKQLHQQSGHSRVGSRISNDQSSITRGDSIALGSQPIHSRNPTNLSHFTQEEDLLGDIPPQKAILASFFQNHLNLPAGAKEDINDDDSVANIESYSDPEDASVPLWIDDEDDDEKHEKKEIENEINEINKDIGDKKGTKENSLKDSPPHLDDDDESYDDDMDEPSIQSPQRIRPTSVRSSATTQTTVVHGNRKGKTKKENNKQQQHISQTPSARMTGSLNANNRNNPFARTKSFPKNDLQTINNHTNNNNNNNNSNSNTHINANKSNINQNTNVNLNTNTNINPNTNTNINTNNKNNLNLNPTNIMHHKTRSIGAITHNNQNRGSLHVSRQLSNVSAMSEMRGLQKFKGNMAENLEQTVADSYMQDIYNSVGLFKQNAKNQYQPQIEAMKDQVSTLKSTLTQRDMEVESLRQKIELLEREKHIFNDEKSSLVRDKAEVEKKLEKYKKGHKDLHKEIADKSVELHVIKSKLGFEKQNKEMGMGLFRQQSAVNINNINHSNKPSFTRSISFHDRPNAKKYNNNHSLQMQTQHSVNVIANRNNDNNNNNNHIKHKF